MKILYAASEATPFAKSGGLADVAGSLPKALVKDGVDARVIMPLYGDLKMRDKLEYVTNYSVPVGWRSQYCGLFKAEVNGVTYYFLDNEYYFKRRGLYGFYDDPFGKCAGTQSIITPIPAWWHLSTNFMNSFGSP